jgi:uncharacterized membrane protein
MATTTPELSASPVVAASKRPGLIKLDIYHLFWIFVISSIIGLIIETVFYYVLYQEWQNRYGLVWGPFSPIYGCGALLFTLTLNRLWNSNVIGTFFVSMIVGCTLEYLTAIILQSLFGISAWDYSGSLMNIGGKISVVYGLMWGLLGVTWIRLLLPLLNRLLERASLLRRPSVTMIAVLLISFDIATTVVVLDREFQRARGVPAETTLAQICDRYFSDEWCAGRFENMNMNIDHALR